MWNAMTAKDFWHHFIFKKVVGPSEIPHQLKIS